MFQIRFHIQNGVTFGCLFKKTRFFFVVFGSNLRLRVGVFFEEGPAFRCPESVALAADFEREGAAVFWVEAEGVGSGGVGGWGLGGDFRVGRLIYIYIHIFLKSI